MEDQGDNKKRIERRAAVRRKMLECNDLDTLHDLALAKAKPIVELVKKTFEEVAGDSQRPTEEERKALLAAALVMNEKFKEERAEQGAAAEEAPSCDTELTPEEIAEFNTKMMGPQGVDELSAMLIERIVEEQTRRKEEADKRDAGAAGNGGSEGGSRKRKRSKKRKGKGNKTRKNAQNNNNNNTTRRRKKTARRRRTKRA